MKILKTDAVNHHAASTIRATDPEERTFGLAMTGPTSQNGDGGIDTMAQPEEQPDTPITNTPITNPRKMAEGDDTKSAPSQTPSEPQPPPPKP